MIHGGGHVMLSRKDIRPKQTQLLLARGYLPVSIDYRLCPETNLIDGPMADVCDALRWARHELPSMDLGRRAAGLQIDSDKIAVVGWSTGGHLAMTLAWTSVLQGLQPPDAILAFYCPTDYEDPCWQAPNIPEGSSSGTIEQDYDLLEAVRDVPITGYNVPPPSTSTGGKSSALAIGGWLSLIDPRSRIALHMNWKAQALPVLLHGLPPKRRAAPGQNYHALPQPAAERIVAASPRAQIIRGVYRTPTCLVHGTKDDLIPWRQSEGTAQALRERGVDARCEVVDGAVHLFDLYRGGDVDGRGSGAEAVRRGYEFLFERV